MKIEKTAEYCTQVLNELNKHIIGKEQTLKHIMVSFLADGHILFEDYPGLAKTTICRGFATAFGCDFKRIQFTPDLLPQDITGSEIYNQKNNEFEFKEGPIFTDIVLADEINRATPKTQSALLEAMAEYQVTIGNQTYPLRLNRFSNPDKTSKTAEKPFLVVATQNPLELEGTFALPEAQIDRFISKVRIGYPSKDSEITILTNRIAREKKEMDIQQITDRKTFYDMQRSVENVHVSDEIKEYIVEIVQKTRTLSQVKVGASPRGSLDLLSMSRGNAVLHKRDYVIPQDVKDLAIIVLRHRLILETSSWLSGGSSDLLIENILKEVKAPRKD